jgi:hypothetical protein
LTLFDDGQTTADIDGLAVVLYDGNGAEQGSGRQDGSGTFLAPGQALTWTEPGIAQHGWHREYGRRCAPGERRVVM